MAEELPDLPPVKAFLPWLKLSFDWSWKIIPLLWVVYQFVATSNQTAKSVAAQQAKIQTLENTINQLDRQLIETKADLKSLREDMNNDRQFFLQIQRSKH